jgi:hypothetical protein
MIDTDVDMIDKLAMGLSAVLAFLSLIGLGIIELLAGQPYNPAPMTNDAGEVIASPAIDPSLRVGLLIAAFLVLFLWGLYKMATSRPARDLTRRERDVTAD